VSFSRNKQKIIRITRLRFLGSFLAAYVFEALALWFYLYRADNEYFVWLAAAAHITSAFSFILVTAARRGALYGVGFYYPRLAALFSFFMPVIGLIGISITLFISLIFMHKHGLAEDYRQKSYEGHGLDVELPTDVTEFLYDEVDVHPIADVLAGEDLGMKRGAINLLRRIGSAEAVKLLRKSISDENTEIRFYAHTALTRLEEDYAESIEKSRFRAERYDSAPAHAEMAKTYRNYARSGLPERNMRSGIMEQACDHWKIAVEKDPENFEYKLLFAEVLCEIGHYGEALDIYSYTIDFPEYELESRLGLCRAYFETGEYPLLFNELRKMNSKPTPESSDPFKLGLYNFWKDFIKKDEKILEVSDDFTIDEVYQ
jgi:tetratricopeptide (TPR) repeat protein